MHQILRWIVSSYFNIKLICESQKKYRLKKFWINIAKDTSKYFSFIWTTTGTSHQLPTQKWKCLVVEWMYSISSSIWKNNSDLHNINFSMDDIAYMCYQFCYWYLWCELSKIHVLTMWLPLVVSGESVDTGWCYKYSWHKPEPCGAPLLEASDSDPRQTAVCSVWLNHCIEQHIVPNPTH